VSSTAACRKVPIKIVSILWLLPPSSNAVLTMAVGVHAERNLENSTEGDSTWVLGVAQGRRSTSEGPPVSSDTSMLAVGVHAEKYLANSTEGDSTWVLGVAQGRRSTSEGPPVSSDTSMLIVEPPGSS
jgi:hypothetical protein